MISKLLCSALFAIGGVALVEQVAGHQDASARLIAWALVLMIAGYHRHWCEEDGRLSWGSVRLPSAETTHVRYMMWMLPMASARKARWPGMASVLAARPPRQAQADALLLPSGNPCVGSLYVPSHVAPDGPNGALRHK